MKILYGIQGTGNGHITRARHMAKSFAKDPDVQVDYLFTGRKASAFFDMDVFEPYETKRGLSFITQNGRIKHLKTVTNNNFYRFAKDVSELDINSYDLLVNDFEPVSAWAAKKAGLPSISISHQAAFLHQVPKKDQGLLDKVITRYFAPTTYTLGTHWYHFGYNIIPPIVAADLVNQSRRLVRDPSKVTPILVYLPFEEIQDIRQQLQVLSDYQFVCYHPQITENHCDKNIRWNAPSADMFKQDLINCAGVIGNCGFELSTECISLGKPLLVKPLHKQYEQLSNAYTLHKLGLCEILPSVNAEDIDDWLQSKTGIQVDFPTNCDALIAWLKRGEWQASESICKTLWGQVRFPQPVKMRLDELQAAHQ